MMSTLRRAAFCSGLLGVAPASAAHHHHAVRSEPGTGTVALSVQPGTPLEAAARQLEAHDIAQSVRGGQAPLILVGSARLSTGRAAPALFVQLQSAALCGSAGCDTSVYLADRGQWVRVLDSVSGPIKVLASAHGRMRDLMVGTDDRWVWAGQAYRDTMAAPALTGLRRSVERHQAAVARGDAPSPH